LYISSIPAHLTGVLKVSYLLLYAKSSKILDTNRLLATVSTPMQSKCFQMGVGSMLMSQF